MSVSRPNTKAVIDSDTYARNQEFIRQAEERLRLFKEMNEQGRLDHEREEKLAELNKKVREGEEARRLLESLTVSRPQITLPTPNTIPIVEPTSTTTRIEELGAPQTPVYASQTHTTYPNTIYSSSSQFASGSGGPGITQTAYPPTIDPSYLSNNYLGRSSNATSSSNTTSYTYGAYHGQANHATHPVTSYENASIRNAPSNWEPVQPQQYVDQTPTTNTQFVPVQIFVPTQPPNPPPAPRVTPVTAKDIVSMITLPEVENIYQRTVIWAQTVEFAAYTELPSTNCVVHKTATGQVFIQTPPINGTPHQFPVDVFFERWKKLIENFVRTQGKPTHTDPVQQSTHTPHSNSPIPNPYVPQMAAGNAQQPAASSSVDNRPRPQEHVSISQVQRQSQRDAQMPQPKSQPQPQPQTGPQPQPTQPQSQPRHPHKLPKPTAPSHTQLLKQAISKAQMEVNSRPQNYNAEPGPQPSTSVQDSPVISEEPRERNSPDIVPVTLIKRRAPGDADRKRLAKDLLFALGKRDRPDAPNDGPAEKSSKKHATEQLVQNSSTSTTSVLNFRAPTATQQTSSGSEIPPRTNIAQPAFYSSFSVAGPSAVFSPYSASTPTTVAEARYPPKSYTVADIPVIPPPAVGPQRAAPEIRPTGQTPSATVSTSSSQKAPSAPLTSTGLQKNPYGFLLAPTNAAGPAVSAPIAVPQKSPDKVSASVPPFDAVPSTSSKGKASTRPSTLSLATQPVASSSTSNLQGAITQQSDPLFLPATSDDSEGEEGDSDIQILEPEQARRKPIRRKVVNRAYVLVPTPPAKIQRFMRRNQTSNAIPPTRTMVVYASESEEDFSVPLEHINVIDKAAQDAVRLSASRIEVLPCKWDGCDVVTNCAQTLISHLEKAHKSRDSHFTCLWTQCGRRCHRSENHLEKHASIPHRCAYKGCSETFRSGSSLLKHFRRHHKSGEVKPSARPVAMGVKSVQKLPSEPLPAYLCLSRVAQPTPISSKQHASLGPWVLRNINESDTSQTWQKKKNSRYEAGGNPGADYEFLITRTLRPSSYLSEPAHVELADIGMNSEFYEGHQYDESLTIFSRPQPGDDVEELNSPNSPMFAPKPKVMKEAKKIVEVTKDHDEGKSVGREMDK